MKRPKKRAYAKKYREGHDGVFRGIFGGDEEDRTLDLTDANRTLSQLSYAPKTMCAVAVLVYISANFRICQEDF